MKRRLLTLVFILFTLLSTNALAQDKLIFHTESVDSLLVWMQKGCDKNNIVNLLLQPATQLMEQLLRYNEREDVPTFKKTLEEFNPNDSLSGNIYILNNAYQKQSEIANLVNEIKKTDFSENVFSRAIKYFPDGYIPPRNYEVFYSAVGWHWGDAMMFEYIIEDGKYFVSYSEGTPAFIFNLTLVCILYGNDVAEQIGTMENVMSHELFHAIFSDYTNSNWLFWDNENINNYALFVMLNEGLGHYIADGELLRTDYHKDDNLKQKEKQAFTSLSDSIKVIFNIENKKEIRKEALNSGTYGKYWTKYICIPSMFMLYHIEQYYGAEGIKECIKNGPVYFVKKYETLQQINAELPKLPNEIIKFIE